jgi:hypothetical protein
MIFSPPPAFSLSKRWKVARLVSASSSSPRVIGWAAERSSVFSESAGADVVAAEAAPTSERLNPAAPSAGMATFTARFRVVASFVFDIDISSINFERFVSIRPDFIVRLAYNARKAGEVSCVT